MWRAALSALIALSACAVPSDGPALGDPIPYALDSGGVQLTDRPLRIDFGRTMDSTIPSMSKLVGRAPSAQGACLDGESTFTDWPGGPRLVFRSGAFAGWVEGAQSVGARCTAVSA